jgi:hypothetical protein
MELSAKDRSILYRALYGYAQWCRDRACECAQVTSEAPICAVGEAFAEADATDNLRARFTHDAAVKP